MPTKPLNPSHVPSGGGKVVNVLGIPIYIRVSGQDTNGVLSVIESHDSTGGGPPPHIHHREDETFQVLEGEYEFTVAGKSLVAKPGATLFAPRGVAHTYRCLSKGGGKLSVVLTPAGFEKFFEQIGALSPQQQQDIPRVLEIANKFGLEFLLPKP
ncbi:MAG: cupin domain-containing protein [Verrucomicrobiota bacterium]